MIFNARLTGRKLGLHSPNFEHGLVLGTPIFGCGTTPVYCVTVRLVVHTIRASDRLYICISHGWNFNLLRRLPPALNLPVPIHTRVKRGTESKVSCKHLIFVSLFIYFLLHLN